MSRPEGLFESDSVLRRLAQESVALLGGGRSLLLQLAHPMVAAGVAEHSHFRADPLRRLENTLLLMRTVIFGNREQAEQALRGFHSGHAHIAGRMPHTVGPFQAGTPYTGHDPELKLWVHATLIDTLLVRLSVELATAGDAGPLVSFQSTGRASSARLASRTASARARRTAAMGAPRTNANVTTARVKAALSFTPEL